MNRHERRLADLKDMLRGEQPLPDVVKAALAEQGILTGYVRRHGNIQGMVAVACGICGRGGFIPADDAPPPGVMCVCGACAVGPP